MRTFRDYVEKAEVKMEVPINGDMYDKWGKDIKKYAELVWPEIARWTLMDKAAELCIDTMSSSPIEIKM